MMGQWVGLFPFSAHLAHSSNWRHPRHGMCRVNRLLHPTGATLSMARI